MNKTILRARVHRPVEDARIERLSAKLLELASKPKDEIKVIDSNMAIDDEQGLLSHSLLMKKTHLTFRLVPVVEGDVAEEARATPSDESMSGAI